MTTGAVVVVVVFGAIFVADSVFGFAVIYFMVVDFVVVLACVCVCVYVCMCVCLVADWP